MKNVISVRHLSKTFRIEKKAEGFGNRVKSLFAPEYREVRAVDGISFSVGKGEKVAFLGPNGAGKSTTIKMLSGILVPTSGEVEVCGLNPSGDRSELVYRIGAVFGQTSKLWYHLSSRDSFELLSRLYGMDRTEYAKRLEYLVPAFGLSEFFDSPVRKLSLGQRMRSEVAASLLHNPEIVFLDEPTIGLDMVAKDALREVINAFNREFGTTVLLTSHDIGDVERVCERVVIINHGRIVSDTTIGELRKDHVKTKVLKFRLASGEFSAGEGASLVSHVDGEYVVEVPNSPSALKKALDRAYAAGEVEDFSIEDPSLEEIIRTFY